MRYVPTVVEEGLRFPETPRWHAGHGKFYFVDIDRGHLRRLDEGGSTILYRNKAPISGVAFDDGDGFYVVSVFDRKILHVTNCRDGLFDVEEEVDCSAVVSFGINDMIRAPGGGFYVGGMDYDAVAGFSGKVERAHSPLLFAADGQAAVASRCTFFPNGCVIPPAGDRLILGDTYAQKLFAWPLGADGVIGEARVFADLPGEAPDGICLDVEGGVWVASHNRCIRVLEGGTITDEVDLGDQLATACMLGGADGRTLLITTAATADREVLRHMVSGRLYQVQVATPGAGLPSIYAA